MLLAAMVAQAFQDVEARHQLLEGFVRRLAKSRDADAYALRGGILVRHWFPNVGRPVGDIDLVCALPYDAQDLRGRLADVLATQLPDGVTFDAERFRVDQLRPRSMHPGLRLFATGRDGGWSSEMTVDLTFGLDVWPAAGRGEFQTERGSADLWMCQPEMLLGRKLQVTAELWRRFWRPKDLGDLWLLAERFAPTRHALDETIERSFAGQPSEQIDRFAEMFASPSFWADERAARRWQGYVRKAGLRLPRDIERVLAPLRTLLTPVSRTR